MLRSYRLPSQLSGLHICLSTAVYVSSFNFTSTKSRVNGNSLLNSETTRNNISELHRALEAQESQRLAKKAAFLEWQAGQREKGAAHRLLHQAKVAESNKRRHYHHQRGRLMCVSNRNSIDEGSFAFSYWNQKFERK